MSIALRHANSFIMRMKKGEAHLLNAGLYTVPEAARLTRISAGKIRRGIGGYDFKSGGSVRHSPAVLDSDIKPLEDKLALSFRDRIEIRFVDDFLLAG